MSEFRPPRPEVEGLARSPLPPAGLLVSKTTIGPALELAPERGIEIEVLTVETFQDAQAAADRIEEARQIEREQTGGVNRIEGVVASTETIYRKRDSHNPVIITAPSSGVLDSFWRAVRVLEAGRQEQAD